MFNSKCNFFFSLSPYRKHLIPQISKFALVKFARCHGTGLAQIDLHLQFEDSELHDICFTDTFSLFSRERDPAAKPAARFPSTSLLLLTKCSQTILFTTHWFF